MDTQTVTVSDVVKAIPEDNGELKTNEFTTSQGVVFRTRSVSPFLLRDAQKKLKAPKPPLVFIEGKGTHEENPSDPDYIEAMTRFAEAQGELHTAVLIARGLELLHCPENVERPEDDSWIESLEEVLGDNIDIAKTGRKRFYCWVRYVAVTSMDDYSLMMDKLTSRSSTTREEDVAEAMDDFRSDATRDTDSTVSPVEAVGLGDTDTLSAAAAG